MFFIQPEDGNIRLGSHRAVFELLTMLASPNEELARPEADSPLVSAGEHADDIMIRLEADLANDVAKARIDDVVKSEDELVAQILAAATAPNTAEVRMLVLDREKAGALAHWANRQYVTRRMAELNEAEAPVVAGHGEGADMLFAQLADAGIGMEPEDTDQVEMNGETVLFAALATQLQVALAATR